MSTVTESSKRRSTPMIVRWAVGLAASALFIFVLTILDSVFLVPIIGESRTHEVLREVFGYIMIGAALGSLVLSIISLVKGERSWIVWVSLVVSVLFVLIIGVMIFFEG